MLGEGAQNHALEPFEMVEAIMAGGGDGLDKGLARIVMEHSSQATQSQRSFSRRVFFYCLDIADHGLAQGSELFFFG